LWKIVWKHRALHCSKALFQVANGGGLQIQISAEVDQSFSLVVFHNLSKITDSGIFSMHQVMFQGHNWNVKWCECGSCSQCLERKLDTNWKRTIEGFTDVRWKFKSTDTIRKFMTFNYSLIISNIFIFIILCVMKKGRVLHNHERTLHLF
jgi:hypothetical protein